MAGPTPKLTDNEEAGESCAVSRESGKLPPAKMRAISARCSSEADDSWSARVVASAVAATDEWKRQESKKWSMVQEERGVGGGLKRYSGVASL